MRIIDPLRRLRAFNIASQVTEPDPAVTFLARNSNAGTEHQRFAYGHAFVG